MPRNRYDRLFKPKEQPYYKSGQAEYLPSWLLSSVARRPDQGAPRTRRESFNRDGDVRPENEITEGR